MLRFRQDGSIVYNSLRYWHEGPLRWDEILGAEVTLSSLIQFEMAANSIFTATLLMRKQAVADALHFVEGLPTYEDRECDGQLAQRGLCAYLASGTAGLAAHAGEFRAVCIRQHHLLIRALLRQGRLREAREVLSRTETAPPGWKVI